MAIHQTLFDELMASIHTPSTKPAKPLADQLLELGIQKVTAESLPEDISAQEAYDLTLEAIKAAHEALEAPLPWKTADQRVAEAIEARKAHSEPRRVYENNRLPFDARPPSSELGLLP